MRTSRALSLAFCLLAPTTLHAQRGLLDHAETRIANAELPLARSLLERWRAENPGADPEEQARYHLLSAHMTAHADSAEDIYLLIAVTYPTARVAPEALLRLAQARHARRDTTQAIAYLERLIADYPNSDHRTMGAVWLARLRSSRAAKADQCALLRGVEAGTNPETRQYFKAELTRYCGAPVAAAKLAARPPRAIRDTAPRAPAAAPPPRVTPTTTPAATGKVTIQVGAFRELSGAQNAARQLQRAGFTNVRLVRVPGNQLIRVRIGRFADRAAAAETLARLARADLSAVLVTDAHIETPVKQ